VPFALGLRPGWAPWCGVVGATPVEEPVDASVVVDAWSPPPQAVTPSAIAAVTRSPVA